VNVFKDCTFSAEGVITIPPFDPDRVVMENCRFVGEDEDNHETEEAKP
jgi:hypothetical protein